MFGFFEKEKSKIDKKEIAEKINDQVSLFIGLIHIKWGGLGGIKIDLESALELRQSYSPEKVLKSLAGICKDGRKGKSREGADLPVLEALDALKVAESDLNTCLVALENCYEGAKNDNETLRQNSPDALHPSLLKTATNSPPFASTTVRVYHLSEDASKNNATTLENMASKLQKAPVKYKLTGIALSTIIAATLLATALTVMTGGIAAGVAIILAIVIALVPPIFVAGGNWDNKGESTSIQSKPAEGAHFRIC